MQTALASDRFYSIVFALRARVTSRQPGAVLCAIVTLAAIVAAPLHSFKQYSRREGLPVFRPLLNSKQIPHELSNGTPISGSDGDAEVAAADLRELEQLLGVPARPNWLCTDNAGYWGTEVFLWERLPIDLRGLYIGLVVLLLYVLPLLVIAVTYSLSICRLWRSTTSDPVARSMPPAVLIFRKRVWVSYICQLN